MTRTFLEFFAGGGMARAGLGPEWRCLFANDFDPKKAAAYRANWGDSDLHVGDVASLDPGILPAGADLVWGSFPCQDLSLAGARGGVRAARSGSFWPFMALVESLRARGDAPPLVALENVCGTLTSRGGADFAAILNALRQAGYRAGAVVADAAHFVPQSRPRLFVIGVDTGVSIPEALLTDGPDPHWSTPALQHSKPDLWWRLPPPPVRNADLIDILESDPPDAPWRSETETARLIELMAPLHQERVAAALAAPERRVGAVYRRTRGGVQRAEIRYDGLAGCLRTPAGGSSRQVLLVTEGGQARSRLLSAREAARLMGLPDAYRLPPRYGAAYHLLGDGVAPPVVGFLRTALFDPILAGR